MTLMMTRVGQVILGVNNHLSPTDEDWSRWLALMRELPTNERVRVVVEAYGGEGPDARQRKQLQAVTNRYPDYRVAVFTDSLLTRGIITAVSWLGVPVRGYNFGEHSIAFRYLDLTANELEAVVPALDELRRQADVDLERYAGTHPRVWRLSRIRRSVIDGKSDEC